MEGRATFLMNEIDKEAKDLNELAAALDKPGGKQMHTEEDLKAERDKTKTLFDKTKPAAENVSRSAPKPAASQKPAAHAPERTVTPAKPASAPQVERPTPSFTPRTEQEFKVDRMNAITSLNKLNDLSKSAKALADHKNTPQELKDKLQGAIRQISEDTAETVREYGRGRTPQSLAKARAQVEEQTKNLEALIREARAAISNG